MPVEVAQNIFANFGVLGLIVIAFFVQTWYYSKKSTDRENKLYAIIDTLSKELPEIKDSLCRIEKKIGRD